MAHNVTRPSEPFDAMGGAARVHMVPAASTNLIWLLECTQTGQVAVIDGPDAGPAAAYVREHDLDLVAILNTHTHHDHIGVNRGLLEAFGDLRVVGSAKAAADVPGITERVGDGDTVTLGELEGRVLLTEGHIDGHVSYLFGDLLFGDCLFTAGCGYLFDGPAETMFRSLMTLAELDGDTRVCCGHEYTQDNLRFAWTVEPDNEALAERIREVWQVRADGSPAVPSTMAVERATNPCLRPGSATLKQRVAEAMGRDLPTPPEVFAATRALKDRKVYRDVPDGELPL